MRSVAEIVINDLPPLVMELNAAATASDRPRVRQAAHTIKGLAANFGAQPLIDLARQLECAPLDSSSRLDVGVVEQIGPVSELTIAALKRELGL